MINPIINKINEQLSKVFEGKIYGLAQSVIRIIGNEAEIIPALVDYEGEGKYVGLDDTYPVIIYHKLNSLKTENAKYKGYGDDNADQVNTYDNSLIVYYDRKKLKKLPDEMYLKIQISVQENLKIDPFKTVSIKFNNVILNSAQVFANEYRGTAYKLAPEKNLIAINYTVESTFKKGCFDKCL